VGVKDWIISLFNSGGTLDLNSMENGKITAEIFYKKLAIESCINLISNAVSRSEFTTYQKGNPVRQDNYYLFNVQPNENKSASKFWRDVIHELVYKNECLVIMPKMSNQMYVATNYDKAEYALKGNTYKNVKIGTYALTDTFNERDVMHFELHDEAMKDVIDSMYQTYGDLIAYSTQTYKRSNAKRGALEIPVTYPQDDESQKKLEKLLNEKMKRFFEAENGAVIPLTNGIKYNDLSSTGYKTGSDSRDLKALITDIFEYVAIAFQVPPTLLLGSVADTDKALTNFLTFCVNPIAELLNDEINRKFYSKDEYLARTYIKLDTSLIKVSDIKDVANALDVLLRTGSNTINDNLKILGREPITDPIGDQRFITKNYMATDEFLTGGGTE